MASKERTSWNNEDIEIFLDLIKENKKSRGGKYNWDTIVLRLNAQKGKEFEKKQLENFYSDIRGKFKAWNELKSWTEIGWNEETGCPVIDPKYEKWKAFIKNGRNIAPKLYDVYFLARVEEITYSNRTNASTCIVGGEPGSEWIHRLLTGHPNLCKEQLWVDKDIFIKLVDVLRGKEILSDGRFIHVEEQVGICLFMMAKADSYRDAAERFQHSISTISIYFRAVLKALVSLSCDIIRPYQSFNESPPEIKNNSLYWPFFKNCVEALDGTHIEAVVDDVGGKPYRGRKGNKTWNVMTACDVTKKFPPSTFRYYLKFKFVVT
uniref:Myb/SANT-like domain-containing protein n=1 Tax=Chenopodium quinoa TaxID=63459 RepID=A0A803MDW5_CHEQI